MERYKEEDEEVTEDIKEQQDLSTNHRRKRKSVRVNVRVRVRIRVWKRRLF